MPPWAGTEPVEYPDPDLDDLTRGELAELPGPAWDVAAVLDEWLLRVHGVTSGRHNVGAFLDFLADRGHRVAPIDPGPSLAELLPPPSDSHAATRAQEFLDGASR